MSFKRVNKKILIILGILLFAVLLINGKRITHAFTNLLNGKQEGQVLEEDDLSNVVNEMYITILDDKANVVASTNPETTIHSDYAFTPSTNPRKYVSYSEKYILLLEVKDTVSLDRNRTLLKENVIYNMTLPQYMNGYEVYGAGEDITDECLNFVSDNGVQACGGVYNSNKLKILFGNIGDRYDITFNYQFYIEFDEDARTPDPDLKTFDFGKFGSLQLMLEGEPVPTVQTGTNYSLQVSDLGATSTTGNYIKWTTELKDLRETKYYKGTLEITFGSALGLVIDRENIYEYVDIIVDGETLNKDYESNTSLNGCFYNDSNDCLIPFTVDTTEGIDGGGNDVVLAKKVKLDLRGTDLNGVGSIKVVTTLKNYIIYSSTGMYLGVTAKYNDEDNELDRYNSSISTYYNFYNPTSSYSVTPNKNGLAYGEVADSLKGKIAITNKGKNYVIVDGYDNYSNSLGAYYYMSSKGFMADEDDISDTFTITINGEVATFERIDDVDVNYLVNGIDKVDPALQRQMYGVIDSYNDNLNGNLHNILRGPKNADGDYYWLVISKDTLTTANKNSDGNDIYDVNNSSGVVGAPANWRIYLFNVANANVNVEWTSYLEKVNYSLNDINDHSMQTQAKVNNSASTYTYKDKFTNPVLLRPEYLNNGYIKWDVILDTKVIKNDSDLLHEVNVNVYLPSYVSINDDMEYDPGINTVDYPTVSVSLDPNYNPIGTGSLYTCAGETNGKIGSCTSYSSAASSFTQSGSGTNSIYSFSGLTPYTITASNVDVRDDGLVHFVFFTEVNYDYYDAYNSYSREMNVELVINSNISEYNDAAHMGGNSPMRRYDLVSKSTIIYPYTDLYSDYETISYTASRSYGYFYNYFDTSYYTSYCDSLSSRYLCTNNVYFNGRYQFYIAGDYPEQLDITGLNIDVNYGTELILNLAGVSKDFYTYCDDDTSLCVDINDVGYGYSVELYNLEDVYAIEITAELEFDYSDYGTGGPNLDSEYEYQYGYVVPMYYAFGDYDDYSNKSRLFYLYNEFYKRASLEVWSNNNRIDELSGIFNSSTRVVNSNTDYIELEPFFAEVGNYKLAGKTLFNIIDTDDLREYLTIDNLRIYLNLGEGEQILIYNDGQLDSSYSTSSVELYNSGNKIFKAHILIPDSYKEDSREISLTASYRITLDNSVREADFYNGEYIGFRINTKGERIFDCQTCSSIGGYGEYPSSFDPGSGVMDAYAYVYTSYIPLYYFLTAPAVDKSATGQIGSRKYTVTYDVKTAGKDGPLDMKLKDTASLYSSNYSMNNSVAFNELRALFVQYSHYKNVKLTYKDVTYDVPSENGDFTVGDVTGHVSYMTDELAFRILLPLQDYNDVVVVTYEIETDFNSLNADAIEAGTITEDGKLRGYSTALTYSIRNVAKDENSDVSDAESGGGITVADVKPDIKKSYTTMGINSHKWKVSLNTGIDSAPVTVEDEMEIQVPADQLDAYGRALEFSDLVIKINNTVIYENNAFKNGWEGTVTITNEGLKTTYVFNDTDTQEYLNTNAKIDIEYVTTLNFDKLDEYISSISATLMNESLLTKGSYHDNALAYTNIQRTFGHTSSKAYIGNTTNDLTETNWKIEVKADDKSERNVVLEDVMTLGSDFGNYVSISKFKIVYKETPTSSEEVIYDSEQGINELDGITLSMNTNETFEIGKNGKYNFNIVFSELKAKSSVTITYTVKVDKEEYIMAGEVLDKELVITNKLTDKYLNASYTRTGSSRVSADIVKKFVSLGKDADGFTRIKWSIDVNLSEYYDLSELDGLEVKVTDTISEVFGLEPDSVEVRYLTVKPNGNTVGNLVSSTLYEVTAEDNVVQVKLLDPTNTPNVEISFVTKVVGSITKVKNSVVLEVGNKEHKVTVEDKVPIYAPSVFGVVYSKDMLSYAIYGQKYVDGKITNDIFKFSITEVDSTGNEVDDGYLTISTNGEDGRIEFNGIRYSQPGTYYYKIQEVIEDDKYEYDTSEYIVKVVVTGDDTFSIGDVQVLNASEVVFNNRTVKASSDTDEQEEKPNPNTGTFVKSVIFLLFVGSVIFILYSYKKLNFLQ